MKQVRCTYCGQENATLKPYKHGEYLFCGSCRSTVFLRGDEEGHVAEIAEVFQYIKKYLSDLSLLKDSESNFEQLACPACLQEIPKSKVRPCKNKFINWRCPNCKAHGYVSPKAYSPFRFVSMCIVIGRNKGVK